MSMTYEYQIHISKLDVENNTTIARGYKTLAVFATAEERDKAFNALLAERAGQPRGVEIREQRPDPTAHADSGEAGAEAGTKRSL